MELAGMGSTGDRRLGRGSPAALTSRDRRPVVWLIWKAVMYAAGVVRGAQSFTGNCLVVALLPV